MKKSCIFLMVVMILSVMTMGLFSMPFSKKSCDMSIDDIDFSPRANNSLKRAGVFTIGEIVDLIADDGLLRIRNLGKKTQNEIKTRILDFGYERLSEGEKQYFLYDIINRNIAMWRLHKIGANINGK